jgi:hypothetical protein
MSEQLVLKDLGSDEKHLFFSTLGYALEAVRVRWQRPHR